MIVFMKLFPLKNFWKYELIVNTRSDSVSPILNIKMEKTSIFYWKNFEKKNLLDFMEQNKIDNPKELKEYFIELLGYLEYPDIYKDERKKLDIILKDIQESDMMYKNVIRSNKKQKVIDIQKNKGFTIIIIYQNIKCYNYNDKEYEKEIN